MNLLVLAEDYTTPDGPVSMYYAHSRNKYYIEEGIDVTVISFRSKSDYIFEGVKVYTTKSYEEKLKSIKYDIVLSHAPNIKNHIRFLNKHKDSFENIIFYFHGHEVLKISEVYPKEYDFVKKPVLGLRYNIG